LRISNSHTLIPIVERIRIIVIAIEMFRVVIIVVAKVLQIEVGGLLKLPLSLCTNVYIEDKCLLAMCKIKSRFSAP